MTLDPEILDRIRALGGDTSEVTGSSLAEDLMAISFETVLYPAPVDTPWATATETEPIRGLGEFLKAHAERLKADPEAVYAEMVAHFYRLTEDAHGQDFWEPRVFTPFREGTDDHDEWGDDFADDELTDLTPVVEATGDERPDFVQLGRSHGFPDHLYVCLSDRNPGNPTVWGTDHEEFFDEITDQGSLLEWLQAHLTPDELVATVRKAIAEQGA